jgi:hypothetical protein
MKLFNFRIPNKPLQPRLLGKRDNEKPNQGCSVFLTLSGYAAGMANGVISFIYLSFTWTINFVHNTVILNVLCGMLLSKYDESSSVNV